MVMTNFPSFSLAPASSPDFSLGIEPYEPSYIPSMAEPTDWRAVASQVAQSYNLRPDVLTNMIQAESNFNPYAVSPKGAKGLLQFMPETAAEYGLTDPFDGYANIDAGARYLRKNLDMFGGDYTKAVAAHNAGPRPVKEYGGVPNYPETQKFVSKVLNGIDLGTPLPEAPKLEVGTSPSQYASVQLKSAATPSMSQTRAEDLYRTQKEISALEESKAQALQEMGKQGYMTGQESLAMALTALLPTLIGWGVRGNLEGAAGGAQAGALGAGVGFQGIQNEIKRRDDLSRRVYEDANQQLVRKEAEQENIRRAMAAREERNQELEMLYGQGGLKHTPVPEEVINEIAKRTGQDPDTVRAFSQMNPYQMQNMLYGLGANTKLLGEEQVTKIAGGEGAKLSVQRAKGLAESFEPGIWNALKAGKLTNLYKDPDSPAYKFYAEVAKLKKEVARMNDSGALSQADVEMFAPLTEGSPVYDSQEAIQERLDALDAYIDRKRSSLIDANRMAGRNVAGFFQPPKESSDAKAQGLAREQTNSKQAPLTATNPTTGEKLIYTNEGWKPWHQ